MINLTDTTFDEAMEAARLAGKPVLIDLWAPWCGPCHMVGPIVDQIAEENPDALVAKVNIDECPQITTKFGVRSIPTLLFFGKSGEVVDTQVGVALKSVLENKLKTLL